MKHVKLLEAFEEDMQSEAVTPTDETGALAVVFSIKVHGQYDAVGLSYFTNMKSAMAKFMEEVKLMESDEPDTEDEDGEENDYDSEPTLYICRLKEGEEFTYSAAYDDYFGETRGRDVVLYYDPSSPDKYTMA
jgi:hypothetical protein